MVMFALALMMACGIDAVFVDELEPLYPDRSPIVTVTSGVDAARGTIAGVHIMVTGLAVDQPLRMRATSVEGISAPIWYRLLDVPVEENTGPESRTERWDKAENEFVIRNAPFQVYEVLEPIQSPLAVDTSKVALRVEWHVSPVATPGVHLLSVTIGAGVDMVTLPFALHVYEAVVPPIGKQTLAYTNWFSPANIATYHDLVPWSEPHWAMLRRYADMMARGRQNMFWLRWSDVFTERDGEWTLDQDRLQRYVALFTDAGLYWIEGAPIAGRPGGDWSSPVLELKLGHTPMTGEAGAALFARQCSQIQEAIVSNGWQERWVQHIADEPTDVNAEDYCVAAEMVRRHLPGVPILEATMSQSVVGCVDAWCPQVQAWQANQAFFDGRQAAGEDVWVYTCLRPGGPWLNRLLDQERLRPVYFGWAAAKNGWDGYLHWGLNHWKADPFMHSVVDHPAMPGTENRLPAGDTHVLYPGNNEPWSGVRFEAHRIGLEDRELLGQLPPVDATVIIDQVYRAADEYETEVHAYRQAKQDLLQAVSASAQTPMQIQVLGFPGCPMTPIMNKRVRSAAFQSAAIESIDLSRLPADDQLLRWPAPTVLVDGVDLFGLAPAATPAIACRIYPAGVPTVEAIREALEGH